MTISEAANQQQWDAFLTSQTFSPFLQSWTMGEVYRSIGQEPIRLEMRDSGALKGICQAIVVPAKRGRHLAIQYGPILKPEIRNPKSEITTLIIELTRIAKDHQCSFIRLSPFWPARYCATALLRSDLPLIPSPLHLLAEHIWYLNLVDPDPWQSYEIRNTKYEIRSQEDILTSMRKTTRNLIRRAERDGVTVHASTDPERDLETFFKLYDETRRRHKFVPYTNDFIRQQVLQFSERNGCTLYLAAFNGEVIATSVHMHVGSETSYHHGASAAKFPKVPASYLLQWQAIKDALQRGDHIYNFWGVSPNQSAAGATAQNGAASGSGQAPLLRGGNSNNQIPSSKKFSILNSPFSIRHRHPFAGVTTFKAGFGGQLLELVHCMDVPVTRSYRLTRSFELIRKWRRGF